MPYSITCPGCNISLAVPDGVKGKRVKCKGCGETFVAPSSVVDKAARSRLAETANPITPKLPPRSPAEGDDKCKSRATNVSRRRSGDVYTDLDTESDNLRDTRRRLQPTEREPDQTQGRSRRKPKTAKKNHQKSAIILVLAGLAMAVLVGGGLGVYLLSWKAKAPAIDQMEVVSLGIDRLQDIQGGKAEARDALKNKVIEVDVRALSRKEFDSNHAVCEIQNLHDRDARWLAMRLVIRADFQFSDNRNASLNRKDFGVNGFQLIKCRVRGVFNGFSSGAPGGGEFINLSPAWIVDDANSSPQPNGGNSPEIGASGDLTARWREYRSPTSKFRIKFPADPFEIDQNAVDLSGNKLITVKATGCSSAGDAMSVSAVLITAQEREMYTDDQILDYACDIALQKVLMRVEKSRSPFTYRGRPGREIAFVDPREGLVTGRVILGPTHVYLLIVAGPSSKNSGPRMKAFFESLSIE